eukprot:gene25093-10733_t
MKGVKKENLPSKMCVSCNRPFTWRKKWERCWDEITTCSKRCNAERKASGKTAGVEGDDHPGPPNSKGANPKASKLKRGGRKHQEDDSDSDEDDEDENDIVVPPRGAPLKVDSRADAKRTAGGGRPREESSAESDEDVLEVHDEVHGVALGSGPRGAAGATAGKSGAVTAGKASGRGRAGMEFGLASDVDSTEHCVLAEKEENNGDDLEADVLQADALVLLSLEDSQGQMGLHESEGEECLDGQIGVMGEKERRKAAKKAVKAAKRAQHDGKSEGTVGQKQCDGCNKKVNLLIRCTVDARQQWKMMCGKCWRDVSGGVADGDVSHPHYRYGGLWKNRNAGEEISTKPPPLKEKVRAV